MNHHQLLRSITSIALLVFSLGVAVEAQTPASVQPFGTYGGGPDIINLGDLAIHLSIPIVHRPGRGMDFDYSLNYDSITWGWGYPTSSNYGWSASGPSGTGASFIHVYQTTEVLHNCSTAGLENQYIYIDSLGVQHSFGAGSYTTYDCKGFLTTGFPATATDGSGILLFCNPNQNITTNDPVLTIQYPSGQTITGTAEELNTALQPVNTQDTNGNYLVSKGSLFNGLPTYTDTLGNVVLTTTDGGTTSTGAPDGKQDGTGIETDSNATFTYTGGDGTKHSTVLQTTAYEVKVNSSSCQPGYDSGPANTLDAARLVTKLLLPDGTFYSFTYEQTTPGSTTVTGRIASITFPQGGSVSYSYSPTCFARNDGTPSSMTRKVNDGKGNIATWTYQRSLVTYQGNPQPQTIVTDPLGNQTVYLFLEGDPYASTLWPPEPSDPLLYLNVSKTSYQGDLSAGFVLGQTSTCYNTGSSTFTPACTMAVTTYGYAPSYGTYIQFPINSVQTSSTLTGGNLTSGTVTSYNAGGLPTEISTYDYGSTSGQVGNLLSQTQITYSNALGTILDKPSTVTQYGASGNLLSLTTYGYDAGSVASNGATNQQTVMGSRGNLTSITRGEGATSLTTNLTYYNTGLVASSTTETGVKTTYIYGQCNSAFLTGTSAGSLSTSTTWDCTGEVPLTSTDVNGNVTKITAYDLFGRPTSVVDQLGNTTTLTYPGTGSNTSTASIAYVGGLPGNYTATSYDGLGRPILQQIRQGPTGSAYSSNATIYDLRGPAAWTSVPYTAALGIMPTNYTTSGPGQLVAYDALGRVQKVTDAGGGTVTYTYSQNDALIAVGPVVSGENVKARQLEYNGAAQLTSVCEITAGTSSFPSGACGQNTAAVGYLTAYTYTGAQLASVSQNKQAGPTATQTRTMSYDLLGRKVREQLPETGTSTFIYDTDTTGKCPLTNGNTQTYVNGNPDSYVGQLVSSIDNIGNETCYSYDSMGRLNSFQVVSGQYAALTPQTHLVYDAATLSGTAMQNAKGNIAEAYTCTGGCTTKLTDIFNSSTIQSNGQVLSQMWESTPNSGGYFLTQTVSNTNGVLASFTATKNGAPIGIPTINYGLDTWGRPATVSDVTHSLTLVSSTTYNPLTGGITGIGLGNGDTDGFGYDPATGRPTSFNYGIGGTSSFTVSGGLTWNPNGSLQRFTLTDSSNATNNQNCNYTSDDIARLSSVNCAGSWAQNFNYDPFGNISKSGPSNPGPGQITQSYSASYSSTSNHVSGGVSAGYDGNGNQTVNATNNMVWNAASQPVIVNGVGAIYDAAGRLVETGDVIAPVPATGSSGSIVVGGTEQVRPAGTMYKTTATITISGSEQSKVVDPSVPSEIVDCGTLTGQGSPSGTTYYCNDSGGGALIVMSINPANGQPTETGYPISYGAGSSATGIASSLQTEINATSPASGVSATLNGSSLSLTINQVVSAGTNYQVLAQITASGAFPSPSFTTALTVPPVTTTVGPAAAIYDSGTISATVDGVTASYPWGSSDTNISVAQGLANALNQKDAGLFTATPSNGTITLTSVAPGPATYSVSSTSTFSNAFFVSSFSPVSTQMTGGFPGLPGTTTSGTYNQTVYAPDGTAIGTVRNSTLVSATIPLIGGGDAVYNTGGFSYFRHKDWLGSSRLATTWTHGVYSKTAYGPFGENYNQTGTADIDFTSQTQDSASSLVDFPYRKYDSAAGRWTTPDPAGWSVVALNNPQTFNRYAYVLNNPMSYVDPTGLDACATINDDGTATIYNAAFVDCEAEGEENSIYIESDVAVTGIGVDANGDLTVYGTSDGGLYNPDGSDYDVAQSVTVFSDGTSSSIVPGIFYSPSTQYVSGAPSGPTGGPSSATNNGETHSDCVKRALLSNAASLAIDVAGAVVPGVKAFGTVGRLVGAERGFATIGRAYQGVVADQQGAKAIKSLVNSASAASTLGSAGDTSSLGIASTVVSTAALIGGAFVPGVGQVLSVASFFIDAAKTYNAVQACPK